VAIIAYSRRDVKKEEKKRDDVSDKKQKAPSKRMVLFRVGVSRQLAWCGRRDLPGCGQSGARL
jgi:hypothetical protein